MSHSRDSHPCLVCGATTRSADQLCTAHRNGRPGGARWKIRDDELSEIARMTRAGCTDPQIAVALGVTRTAVAKARQRRGIPPGRPQNGTVLDMPRRRTTSYPTPNRVRVTLTPEQLLQAHCRQTDPEVFYELPNEKSHSRAARDRIAAAKQVCSGCPIAAACLQVAITNAEPFGVWAGLTPDERAQLQRKRAAS